MQSINETRKSAYTTSQRHSLEPIQLLNVDISFFLQSTSKQKRRLRRYKRMCNCGRCI